MRGFFIGMFIRFQKGLIRAGLEGWDQEKRGRSLQSLVFGSSDLKIWENGGLKATGDG